MISPELLRRSPFFGALGEANLKAIAMISEEVKTEKDVTLFNKGDPAEILYLLIEGGVDLYDVITSEHYPDFRKEYLVTQVSPGEVLALASLIEPHVYSLTAKTTASCRLIKIEARVLRELADKDCAFGYKLMKQAGKLAYERLGVTRSLLAAAISK